MAELLFEILSEEMPAGVQDNAANDLLNGILAKLRAAGLDADPVKSAHYVTPRRIAIVLSDIATVQPDRTEERKGPKVGAPEQAVQGFLRSAGLASLDEAENRDGVYFAVKRIPGGPTADLLPGLLIDAMLALRWPKSMRWRDTRLTWVRPIRNLLGIFDGKVLAGGLHLGHAVEGGRQPGYATAEEGGDDRNFLPFNSLTYGHRFLAPAAIEVTGFADYAAKLGQAFVMLDAEARKAAITKAIADKASELGLTQIDDPRLLDEVAGLVESPVPLIGAIDQQFLDLPPEVLTTSMRTHQKYFALTGADGRVSHFAVVANISAADGGAAIVAGNERVLRARLSDARFFWDLDRRTPLDDFARKLDARVFHAKLGTVADKVERVASLAREIAAFLGADPIWVGRAANLAKADLSSGMVGEFPELQGAMGRYYALEQGEPKAVADAIRDHYAPVGPTDIVPASNVSSAVALADKIDTLVTFFVIDEKPTGSKDPYALRRAALGIIRIILENNIRLNLVDLFGLAQQLFLEQVPTLFYGQLDTEFIEKKDQIKVPFEALSFIKERLKVYLRERNASHDVVQSLMSYRYGSDLIDLRERVVALMDFLNSDGGKDLLVAFRRAHSILSDAEKSKLIPSYPDLKAARIEVDPNSLEDAHEILLSDVLQATERVVQSAVDELDFRGALEGLSRLREPVDAFFTNVKVNVTETRLQMNRLALLNELREIFLKVADFSVIEG